MRRGFTLIELIVVIAIIALLTSIVLASISSARCKTKQAHGEVCDSQVENTHPDKGGSRW